MKNKYIGSGVFAVLILLLSPLLIGGSCNDTKSDPVNSTPPVLSVTPIDMSGSYDPTDSTIGDIRFEDPVIIPFGYALTQYQDSPAIEYYARPDAPVRAVAEAIVENVIANPPEQGDYEIITSARPGADYTIIYDHVLQVEVVAGERIYPGDTLGLAGTWSATMRRTELQINYGEGSDLRAYCPLNYGSASFLQDHRKIITEYNNRGFTPYLDTLCITGPVIP